MKALVAFLVSLTLLAATPALTASPKGGKATPKAAPQAQVDPRVKDCSPLQAVVAQISAAMPIEAWGMANDDEMKAKLLALAAKMQALPAVVEYDVVILLQHEEGFGMILVNIVGDNAFACKAFPIGQQWMSEFAEIIGLKKVDDGTDEKRGKI